MAQKLSRQAASDAVSDLGWRFLLGRLCTSVTVGSLAQAADVAASVAAASGAQAAAHLHIDLRPDRIILTVQSMERAALTTIDVDLVDRISAVITGLGLTTRPHDDIPTQRSIQLLEIAIDALNIAAVRPFWKAVLGYADMPGAGAPEDPIVDPVGQGPAIWFQQMDQPRPQRNRIHVDISVPHDEAPRRIAAAVAAGGRLVSATRAPSFWVLADVEGNEACITTWQGRD